MVAGLCGRGAGGRVVRASRRDARVRRRSAVGRAAARVRRAVGDGISICFGVSDRVSDTLGRVDTERERFIVADDVRDRAAVCDHERERGVHRARDLESASVGLAVGVCERAADAVLLRPLDDERERVGVGARERDGDDDGQERASARGDRVLARPRVGLVIAAVPRRDARVVRRAIVICHQ